MFQIWYKLLLLLSDLWKVQMMTWSLCFCLQMIKRNWELRGEADITWSMETPIMEAWRESSPTLGETLCLHPNSRVKHNICCSLFYWRNIIEWMNEWVWSPWWSRSSVLWLSYFSGRGGITTGVSRETSSKAESLWLETVWGTPLRTHTDTLVTA